MVEDTDMGILKCLGKFPCPPSGPRKIKVKILGNINREIECVNHLEIINCIEVLDIIFYWGTDECYVDGTPWDEASPRQLVDAKEVIIGPGKDKEKRKKIRAKRLKSDEGWTPSQRDIDRVATMPYKGGHTLPPHLRY